MKFSYHWLRELVDGLDVPAKDLALLVTLKTAECEGVHEVGSVLASASEAVVLSVEPMGTSHNRKTIVETERYGKKTVVCGAPNCRVGLRTAYVPLGKKSIEGVESDGMLASAAELGIGRDHAGIVELDRPLKMTPDYVIEVDNKSLTHRPDLWGHYGMAREVAAILGKKLLDPVKPGKLADSPPAIRVTVENYGLCPRYSALVFENVRVCPSPLWLQYRLEAIGLNSINNIVDVTNYVLAELTQPMHAFDADKIQGGEIIVRLAAAGENFAALNGETYSLEASHLVIADSSGAIALAGVIGGADSAISEGTTRIVLESANFNASSVRKTSARIKLRTDASMRFEKAQDPATTVRGLKRALELLEEVSPGIRLVGGLVDAYRPLPEPEPIVLRLDWLDRKLGRAIPASEVRRILESLEFRIHETASRTFSVTIPSWRATKDISIKDDLVEEIGRMVGYDSIPPVAPLTPARVPPANPERAFHHHVSDMAAAQGFTEVSSYSFMNEEMVRAFDLDRAGLVEVENPISSDQTLLRSSLLPGMWKAISGNIRHFDAFRLFEIGREIHKDRETPHFAAAIYAKDDGAAGLLELKRLAECLDPQLTARPVAARSYEHPQRSAEVYHGDTRVGRLFEFHPRMVETGRAAVLDLDLTLLPQPGAVRYQTLRRFPTSAFDLSVVAGKHALIGELESRLRALAGGSLVSIVFLRDFALPDGTRSLSYRLTLGAADRTLSSDEVSAVRTRIIDSMRGDGYELKV